MLLCVITQLFAPNFSEKLL